MSLKQYEPSIKEFFEMVKDAGIDYSCCFTDDESGLRIMNMHANDWHSCSC